MFLLFSGLKVQVPEKSGCFARKGAKLTKPINKKPIVFFISSPFDSPAQWRRHSNGAGDT
jgi:hypothetical protein